jgi:hypothetical protein
MALSLNKQKIRRAAAGQVKAYEYQSVILPIIVIRRLECVMIAWREAKGAEVLANRPKLRTLGPTPLSCCSRAAWSCLPLLSSASWMPS